MFLRQSTSQIIRFGPFLDSTDGVTPEVALVIAQADMQLSKDGGAFGQKNAAGNATHDTDGWYSTTLDITDTNTVGELYLQVNVAGALPVWVRWWVIEEAVYDDFYGAAATGYLKPTVATRTLDVAATGEAGVDLGNAVGSLSNANADWVDGNDRVDVSQIEGVDATDQIRDSILDDATRFSGANIDAAISSRSDFDETSDPVELLDAGGAAGTSAAELVTDIWANASRTLTALGFTLDTADFAAAFLTAALIATDAITSDELATSAINEIRDGILDDATRFSGANIDAAISTRATPAQVNTEVSDVLKIDTIADLAQQAPPATPTFEEAVMYLYSSLRNRIDVDTVSGDKEFYNNAATLIWKKAISDAGGIYSEAEGVSGP